MFKLIDYREDEWSDGFGGQIDYYYKLRNVNTNEERWVNEYEFNNIRRKGLLYIKVF